MLIVHIISTQDTKDFDKIYEGLEFDHRVSILINPSKSLLVQAIIKEKGTIVFIGHGTEYGLLNRNLDGYIIDSKMVQHLRGKKIVGIWCNASTFASKYDLEGFFTSMFISNSEELLDCGFPLFEGCDAEITQENRLFSTRLNELLKGKRDITLWADILREASADSRHRFVHYNYEALYSSE
jgi:hypothetical protein